METGTESRQGKGWVRLVCLMPYDLTSGNLIGLHLVSRTAKNHLPERSYADKQR